MVGKKRDFAQQNLSRRERQIMDVIYRRGKATVAEIVAEMPDPPTRDAVRRMAHILEEKGLLDHKVKGPRNVYFPTVKTEQASRNVLGEVVDTFFGGSTQKLVAALLDIKKDELTDEELRKLSEIIDSAAGEGR